MHLCAPSSKFAVFSFRVTTPLMPSGSESGVQSGVNTENHAENLKITVEDLDNNENEEHIDKADTEVPDDDSLLEE